MFLRCSPGHGTRAGGTDGGSGIRWVQFWKNLLLAQVIMNSISFNWHLLRGRKFEIHNMKTWRNFSGGYCKLPMWIWELQGSPCNRARLISVPQPPQPMIYAEGLLEEKCFGSIWAFSVGRKVHWVHLGFFRCGAFELSRGSLRTPATDSELMTGFVLCWALLISQQGSVACRTQSRLPDILVSSLTHWIECQV